MPAASERCYEMENFSSLHKQELELQSQADALLREYWLKENFLTWEWWLLVALTIVPWIIWWRFVDRKRIFEILTYGFLVMVVSVFFDAIGVEFDLWDYQYRLIPLFDVMIVYCISVMPVIYMLIYQYYNSWKSFIAANIIVSAVFAFISEPLLVKMGIYIMFKWQHYYSFPIYLSIAIFLRYLILIIKKISINNEQ